MGLTLHYELRLPGTVAPEGVDHVLADLHEHAKTLAFAVVTEPARLIDAPSEPHDDSANDFLRLMAEVMSEPYEGIEGMERSANAETARAFLIDPGDGCEAATVGFLYRPEYNDKPAEWFWRCACKTQYASVKSDEHFVKCHTTLVALLDYMKSTGVELKVIDEGDYWETRDTQRLLQAVGHMNRIVAAFAGRLSDAIGGEHDVQAEIFRHPRFEYLEVERLDDQ